jgi:threonine dehydratase
MEPVTIEMIREARERIAPYIRKTPLLPFEYLSGLCDKEVLLKCESLQRTGSFKLRGAANCILANLSQAKKCGVIAASAGNHAQAVAAICKFLGIKSTIVMPTMTPFIKIQNTRNWGANIELVGAFVDESTDYAVKMASEKGLLFIHPFRDPSIIAGQGTVGLELLEDPAFEDVEAVVISVGGGGWSTGVAIALKALRPQIKVYGVAPRGVSGAWRLFHEGSMAPPIAHSYTLAEGVAVKRPGEDMVKLIRSHLNDLHAISEESIAYSIALLAEHGKLICEGAGALPVAALLDGLIEEKRVALILSGGNIDIPALSHVLQRGLVEQDRLVRLVITISDRPGGLNAVTQILAEKGGNIIQVFHQRTSIHTRVGETEIEVDLETRGKDHTSEIIDAITKTGFKVHRAS